MVAMVTGLATSLSLSTRDTVAPVGLEMVAFVSISSVMSFVKTHLFPMNTSKWHPTSQNLF